MDSMTVRVEDDPPVIVRDSSPCVALYRATQGESSLTCIDHLPIHLRFWGTVLGIINLIFGQLIL